MIILFNADGYPTGVAEGVDIGAYAVEIGGSLVEMNGEQPTLDHMACPDGEWRIPPEVLARWEVEWVASELPVIVRQLEAVEEAEYDATPVDLLPGTRQQWLAYRGKVRNWKEGAEGFPISEQRPVRPA